MAPSPSLVVYMEPYIKDILGCQCHLLSIHCSLKEYVLLGGRSEGHSWTWVTFPIPLHLLCLGLGMDCILPKSVWVDGESNNIRRLGIWMVIRRWWKTRRDGDGSCLF